MRPFSTLSAVLTLLCSVPATTRGQVPDFSGHWEGAIEAPGAELLVRVDLEAAEEGWLGTIDIPQQGAAGLPLTGIAVDGDEITFAIAGVPGDPTFEGALADGAITGTFTQRGAALSFRLSREAVTPARRPQDPEPPYPYAAEEVFYPSGDITLAGTLTLPPGDGPFPAAILLTGSGAQNRDEELMGHRPFLVLADHLTRAGIAVLRADDRGVGGSTGSTRDATTADFADDALAGVAFLRAHPRIDAGRIGLVGHSEGGLVAPLAASRSADVAYVVMLAGMGVPGDQVLAVQNRRTLRAAGFDEARIEKQLALLEEAFQAIRSENDEEALRDKLEDVAGRQIAMLPDEQRPSGDDLEVAIDQAVAGILTPWFRFFLDYDPRPTLESLRVPVLALNGELDVQVDADQNLPEIEAALERAGNPDVTLRRLPDHNHIFQRATTGSPSEYGQIDETMSPETLQTISAWILERFGSAGG